MQLQSRKAARKMLQYASSQNIKQPQDKSICNASINIARDEILNYKDPGKANTSSMSPNTIYNYKDSTMKQLKGLLRPNILNNDKSTINIIGSCM